MNMIKKSDELATIRHDIQANERESVAVSNAPRTPEEIRAKVDAFIYAELADAKKALARALKSAARGDPLGDPLAPKVRCYGQTDVEIGIIGLLALLHEERLKQVIETAMPDTTGAMSANEQAETVKRLTSELLDLEKKEEALIEEAEALGYDILRRADADPRAVIGPIVRKLGSVSPHYQAVRIGSNERPPRVAHYTAPSRP